MDIEYAIAQQTSADEIKNTRKLLQMTQKEFAHFVGCSKPTVERWEVSKDPITGPIVLLIQLLQNDPNRAKELVVPPQVTPLRMWYMYKNRKCTLIDVDEGRRKVFIRNYTDNVMLCAFGVNVNPTYEDYEEFMESRCFPPTRDKMKLILEDLNLPFYDSYLIIERTQGRMAEDDFWIDIVK